MSLEKIHRLERLLLLLMIIALPINCLPKRFYVSTLIELMDSGDYLDRNANSIANTTSRSNGAR